MRNEEKRLLERVHAYCSYGVLVITICFCGLIYWGNQQINGTDNPPKVDHQELFDNGSDEILARTAKASSTVSDNN